MRYAFEALCGRCAQRILMHDTMLTVIAVHSRSVYLRCESGRLLMLCPDSYGSVPFGISMREFDALRTIREFLVGESVSLCDGVLCFSDLTEIVIRCIANSDRDGELRSKMPTMQAVAFCSEYAQSHASRRGIFPCLPVLLCTGTPLADSNAYALCVASQADSIESAFVHGDVQLLSASLRRLLGLGLGLTPSGDDFICGMSYALNYFARLVPRCQGYPDMLRDAVIPHFSRTSEISVEYLRCAFDGEHFDVVDDVLYSLGLPFDKVTIAEATDKLLTVGARSGSDILCGILFAIYLLN